MRYPKKTGNIGVNKMKKRRIRTCLGVKIGIKISVWLSIAFFPLCPPSLKAVQPVGYFVQADGKNMTIRLLPDYNAGDDDKGFSGLLRMAKTPGTKLYAFKPGFQIVTFKTIKVSGDNEIRCLILSGSTNGLWAGEKVYADKTEILKNRDELEKIIKTAAAPGSDLKASFSEGDKMSSSGDYWGAVRRYASVLAGCGPDDPLKDEATYKLAMVFDREFRRPYTQADLADPVNCRELLMRITSETTQGLWAWRANFDIADLYVNVAWQTKNAVFHRFLRQAGPLGEVYFNYGENLLMTVPENSILILEGGDNQVFSLQTLQQIEGKRPDVAVYDQKGNIFDQIYGDLTRLSSSQLFENKVQADRLLITSGLPPENTEIRTFRPASEAFRKRTGPVFYSWKDQPRLDGINKIQRKKSLPVYAFRQYGILYEVVKDGEEPSGPFPADVIWSKYRLDWDREKCLSWPYLIREILANYQFQLGDFFPDKPEKQMQYYDEARRIGFDMVAIHFNAGVFYEYKGRNYLVVDDRHEALRYFRKAAACYSNAVAVDPREPRAYMNFAGAYETLASLEPLEEESLLSNAERILEQALTISSNYQSAKNLLQRVRGKLEFPSEKIKALRKKAVENPKDEATAEEYMQVLMKRGDLKTVESFLRGIIQYYPANWKYLNYLGSFNAQLGNITTAIGYYGEMGKIQPDNAAVFFTIAELYKRQGDTDRAIQTYKHVIQVGSTNPQFEKEVASARNRLSELESAEENH